MYKVLLSTRSRNS